MHMNKRLIVFVVIVVMLVLTGCQQGGNQADNNSTAAPDPAPQQDEQQQDTPVTIKYWAFPRWNGINGSESDGKLGDWQTDAAQRFMEQHPHVTVETEYLNFSGGPEKVAIALQTNNIPNVFEGSVANIFEYAQRGLMLPLDDYVDATFTDDYYENIWEQVQYAGKHYYFPWGVTPQVMMVNRTLFEQAGVADAIPTDGDRTWTFDEYYAAVKTVTDKLDDVYGTGIFANTATGDSFALNWLWSAGATTFDPQTYKVTLNSPEGLAGLIFLKQMIDSKVASPGAAGLSYNDVATLFNQEKVATMAVATSGYARVIKAQQDGDIPKFDIDLVSMPSADGKPPATFVHPIAIAVFNNEDEYTLKWSVEFAKFLAGEENAGAVKAALAYSARKSVGDLYSDSGDDNLIFANQIIKYAVDGGVAVPGFNRQRVMYGNKLQKYFFGEITAEQMLAEFEQEADAIVAEEMARLN